MHKLSARLASFVVEINPPLEGNICVGHFDSDEFKYEIFDIGASSLCSCK